MLHGVVSETKNKIKEMLRKAGLPHFRTSPSVFELNFPFVLLASYEYPSISYTCPRVKIHIMCPSVPQKKRVIQGFHTQEGARMSSREFGVKRRAY